MKQFKLLLSILFLAFSAGIVAQTVQVASEPVVKEDLRLESLKHQGDIFLRAYMPQKDKGVVSEEYLQNNLELALKAFANSPWYNLVPDSIFLNDILPYSSIGEEVDAWRPVFFDALMPLVSECATISEAAELLNREIWTLFNVTYSPKRDKPDQSPFHSMRIGIASCTGLSIMLVDACRAVGIPARFAGCNWKNKPGNHSWIEVWDQDGWHFLGAEDAPKLDNAWFNADVIYADATDPEYSIYATTWKPTGCFFYGTWCDSAQTAVPAYNVTERYLKQSFITNIPRLSIKVVNKQGTRIVLPLYVVDAKTGALIAHGNSFDDHFDLNRHFNIALPQGSQVKIYSDSDYKHLLGEYTFGKKDYLLKIVKR